MNGWLIAGIVIGAIAAIVAIAFLLLYLFAMAVDFDEKDWKYMHISWKEHVKAGHSIYISCLLLGVLAAVCNMFEMWGHGTFWEETSEHNIIFIIIFVGILMLSILQALIVYDDKNAIKRKIWLNIYYCFLGFFGGILVSIVIFILIIFSIGKDIITSRGDAQSFTLSDGTVVEEARDLIMGVDHNHLVAIDGSGRRYRREGDTTIEI